MKIQNATFFDLIDTNFLKLILGEFAICYIRVLKVIGIDLRIFRRGFRLNNWNGDAMLFKIRLSKSQLFLVFRFVWIMTNRFEFIDAFFDNRSLTAIYYSPRFGVGLSFRNDRKIWNANFTRLLNRTRKLSFKGRGRLRR